MAEPGEEEAWSEEEIDEEDEYYDDEQGGHGDGEEEDYDEDYGEQDYGEEAPPPPVPAAAAAAEKKKSESPPSPAEEERSKACMVCTFLNFARATRCTMCRSSFESSSSPGSGGATSSGGGGNKSCSRCTSTNEPDARACSVCGSLFPEEMVKNGGTKACSACTMINEASARACSVCGTLFQEPDVIIVPETGGSATREKEVITISDDEVTVAEASSSGTKSCSSCTSMNDSAAGACSVCGSVFPASGEKACPQCTFLNVSSDYACSMCKFPLESSSGAPEKASGGSSSSAPPAAPAAEAIPEEYSCLMCFRDFKTSEEGHYALEHCRHIFCRACIVRHVGRSLSRLSDELVLGVRCPVDCCSQDNLSRKDIRVLAGYEALQQLDHWTLGKLADSFNKSGYLESFYTTVQMLRANYDALVNVKVPVRRRKASTKRQPSKRRRTAQRKPEPEPEPEREPEPEKASGKASTEDLVLDMIKRLSEEIQQAEDFLPYPVTVLLCYDPSLWNLLSWLLRNDSAMEITEHADLYFQAFVLFRILAQRTELYPLFVADSGGAAAGDLWIERELKSGSLIGLFEKLHTQCSFILQQHFQSGAGLGDDGDDNDLAVEAALLSEAKHLYEDLRERVSAWKRGLLELPWIRDSAEYLRGKFPRLAGGEMPVIEDKGKEPVSSEEPEYLRELRLVQFGQAPLLQNHYFREKIDWDSSDVKRTRRISKEIAGLATNLPLQLDSSIHIRVDECRMDLVRALIIGPQGTPYQDGIFLFDIYMGREYPNSPPSVQFLTTGGGTVRFNPNLYDSGKVCLSLLNTWSGPSWMPGSSTVLQVLVSLQSLVFVSEPYYNEPGYSSGKFKRESDQYNRQQMYNTLVHSMLPALKQPDAAFEGVIQAHFRLKRKAIEEQCDAWAKLELPEHHLARHHLGHYHHRGASNLPSTLAEAAELVKSELAARFDVKSA